MNSNKCEKQNINITVKLFCIISIVSAVIVMICILLSRGELINNYFFRDVRDSGMDFFHSIEYVRGRSPYDIFDTLYPPLANLIFYILYRFVPVSTVWGWTYSFTDSLKLIGTNKDLRTIQAPMILFIVAVIIISALIMFILEQFLNIYNNNLWIRAAAFCGLISYGSLYAFERGNVIALLAMACTAFFILYYRSSNKILREIALLAIAFAAGIKLYPAFFGILLLRDKKILMALRTVLYGIISVVLPMLFFKEGLPGLFTWLKIVFSFGSGSPNYNEVSVTGVLYHLQEFFKPGPYVDTTYENIYKWIGYIIALILLASVFFLKKEWQAYLAIVLAIISYQAQGRYYFAFFLIPLFMFLREENSLKKNMIVPYLILLAFNTNIPLFTSDSLFDPSAIFYQLILIIGIIYCILCGAKSVKNK